MSVPAAPHPTPGQERGWGIGEGQALQLGSSHPWALPWLFCSLDSSSGSVRVSWGSSGPRLLHPGKELSLSVIPQETVADPVNKG